MLSISAVALLGSLALVPTQTLAGTPDHSTGRSAHVSAQHRNGNDVDAGHNLRMASHHHADSSHSAKDDDDQAATSSDNAAALARPAPAKGGGSNSSSLVGRGAPSGSATVSASGQSSAATSVLPSSIHSVVLVRGVSLPGTAVPISRPPAANPAATRPQAPLTGPAATSPPNNPVLGPVPVLVPSLGETITHAGSGLPWNWFIAFAIVDLLLVAFVLVRRRRAGSGRS